MRPSWSYRVLVQRAVRWNTLTRPAPPRRCERAFARTANARHLFGYADRPRGERRRRRRECLGLLRGKVVRLQAERVPRLGWAIVEPWGDAYYFAHSFVGTSPDAVATSDGLTVAVRKDSFFGVQFHPEKSGDAGLNFLGQCLSLV